MKKLIILSVAAFMGAAAFVGCNEDTYIPAEETASSVAVYSFKLAKDDSVLANLDTVFFSIDLATGNIFNADSLPFGTKTDRLVPVIRMLDGVSRSELTETRADGTDTIHNYLTNSTDTIDFSNGPAKLMVVSPNGLVSKNYTITVNVHQVKSDSLVWAETARRQLPTTLQSVKAQRTVQCGATLYCLTTDGTSYCMASTDTPDADDWQTAAVTLPDGADVENFAASSEALYILASGTLFTSTDGGASWTSTGKNMTSLYGGYGSDILGAVKKADGWYVEMYPSGSTIELPADMPVSGTSQPVAFDFGMGTSPQIIMTGGVTADGKLSADTWAFDGAAFARISNIALPTALKGVTLVPFFTYSVNSVFVATRYAVMLAFGGNDGASNSKTVYLSNDYGMTWSEAGELMQLPEHIPAMSDAQAFVYPTTMHARSASSWTPFETSYRIPAGVLFSNFGELVAASRAIAPITEWECPYIYLFGGLTADGKLYDTVWKGTINRMTFKPLQ